MSLSALFLPLLLASSPSTAPEPPSPTGLSLQPHLYLSSGWSLTQTTPGDPVEYRSRLGAGTGVGLQLGYDFTPRLGIFASAALGVQDAGPYASSGAGLTLRTGMLGRARLYARLGARLITPVTLLLYCTGGAGAELFLVRRRLSLALELDGALPLASGTRESSSSNDWRVSANSGPVRGLFGVVWYPGL
ncbi:MAG TPA: hypothetical protein VE153_25720 [Myxococcus sp.]|nr:hypothetical protein [Myxococcus sp.]